jgi:hypothetical protein
VKIGFFDDYRLGVILGDSIVDVSSAVAEIPRLAPHDLINGLIAVFQTHRPRLEEAASRGKRIPFAFGRWFGVLDRRCSVRYRLAPEVVIPVAYCWGAKVVAPRRACSGGDHDLWSGRHGRNCCAGVVSGRLLSMHACDCLC